MQMESEFVLSDRAKELIEANQLRNKNQASDISIKNDIQKSLEQRLKGVNPKSTENLEIKGEIVVNNVQKNPITFETIQKWVKFGDENSFQTSQFEFISTTRKIAASKDPNIGHSRNPYITLFSTSVIAFQPLNEPSYINLLKQYYPVFVFDKQPIGKFVLWPPSCQTNNEKLNTAACHGIIKLFIERQRELSNSFGKRMERVERQHQQELDELQVIMNEMMDQKEKAIVADLLQQQKMRDETGDENEDEEDNNDPNKNLNDFLKQQDILNELAQKRAAEDLLKKPTVKDLKFIKRFVHDTKLPINKDFFEVQDEELLKKDPELPYFIDPVSGNMIIKKNFQYPILASYLLPYQYAIVLFIELLDDEIIKNPTFSRFKGIKGIYKCSGFAQNYDEAVKIMEEHNKKYDNVFSHLVVKIRVAAPYPVRKQFVENLLIDKDEDEKTKANKSFLRDFVMGQREMKKTVDAYLSEQEKEEKRIEYEKRLNELGENFGQMSVEQKQKMEEEKNMDEEFVCPYTQFQEDDEDGKDER